MIDKQIRTLAEFEVSHRRFSSFGIRGQIVSLLAGGKLFCAVTTYYGLNDKVGTQYFRGSKRLYRLYDTFGMFSPTDAEVGRGIEGTPAPRRDGGDTQPDNVPESKNAYAANSIFKRIFSSLKIFLSRIPLVSRS